MTSVITSLDSIPNELNNLQSVSECDINMKSAEVSPMMPEDLSLHYSHAQLNIDWHQQGKRRKYVLDDNVDKGKLYFFLLTLQCVVYRKQSRVATTNQFMSPNICFNSLYPLSR